MGGRRRVCRQLRQWLPNYGCGPRKNRGPKRPRMPRAHRRWLRGYVYLQAKEMAMRNRGGGRCPAGSPRKAGPADKPHQRKANRLPATLRSAAFDTDLADARLARSPEKAAPNAAATRNIAGHCTACGAEPAPSVTAAERRVTRLCPQGRNGNSPDPYHANERHRRLRSRRMRRVRWPKANREQMQQALQATVLSVIWLNRMPCPRKKVQTRTSQCRSGAQRHLK